MRRRTTITNSVDHRYFTADLVLRDVSYKDTGTLTCSYNGTYDINSIDNSSSIHLYVEDKSHLLKNSGFDYFTAKQTDSFILPCLPTHPEVNVTLWRNEHLVKDKFITFDPKVRRLKLRTRVIFDNFFVTEDFTWNLMKLQKWFYWSFSFSWKCTY